MVKAQKVQLQEKKLFSYYYANLFNYHISKKLLNSYNYEINLRNYKNSCQYSSSSWIGIHHEQLKYLS